MEESEPSATFFFFAKTLPFFARAAFGSFQRGARGTAGVGAMPPATEVIRGGMKRPHAMPVLGGTPAGAKPKLPALGFAAAATKEGSRV